MKNKIRIRAKSLNLDLVGDAEYIIRAYDAMHPVLIERFEESVEGVLEEPMVAPPIRESMSKTIPMHRPIDPEAAASEKPDEGPRHINVVVCNEVYNKIYLVEREEVGSSMFSRVLDLDGVNRIYINRSQRERFKSFFTFGKVLWRELTKAGKAVVKAG